MVQVRQESMSDYQYVKRHFSPDHVFRPEPADDPGDSRRAPVYVYTEEIILAVNVALATRRPLLVRGPSGSGKSSLARNIAQFKGWRYYDKVITSRTQARDLLWDIDLVRRLHDARFADQTLPEGLGPYVIPGVFWWAFDRESAGRHGTDPQHESDDERAVVLLDEIDKADPDVPNNLLVPLGSLEFIVDETGELVNAKEQQPRWSCSRPTRSATFRPPSFDAASSSSSRCRSAIGCWRSQRRTSRTCRPLIWAARYCAPRGRGRTAAQPGRIHRHRPRRPRSRGGAGRPRLGGAKRDHGMEARQRSITGDVVRAFAELEPRDGATRDRIAALLGITEPAAPAVPPPPQPKPELTKAPARPQPPPWTEVELEVDAPLEASLQPRSSGGGTVPSWIPADPQLDQLVPAPPSSPWRPELFAPGRARGILIAALASPSESSAVDIGAAVHSLARGEELTALPRLKLPTVARGAQLLLDRGDGMLPFLADLGRLQHACERLLGASSLRLCASPAARRAARESVRAGCGALTELPWRGRP